MTSSEREEKINRIIKQLKQMSYEELLVFNAYLDGMIKEHNNQESGQGTGMDPDGCRA